MIKALILLLALVSCSVSGQSLTAQAWLVADSNGKILEGLNTNEVRSIASITKLMTAMVVLDSGQSLT
jgi:D-alanyl-D-alanine endopeptidase (penicillin-binding protein 7)